MKIFTVRLPDILGKWLSKEGKKTGMSMNLIIRKLVEQKKKDKK